MAAIGRIIAVGALLIGSFGAVYFVASGCRSSFDWQGKWTGERTIEIVPGTPDYLQNSIRRVTLFVKENGEYELNASGVPSRGMFHASGRQATLEPVTKLDRPINGTSAIKVTANEDGTISLQAPDDYAPGPILLRREAQPPGSNVRNP